MGLKQIILINTLLFTFCVLVVAEDEQLLFVNILHRHGDRMPEYSYKNDPYNNESLWPYPFGQLTKTGKIQLYQFGNWLRNRYNDFLPKKYSPHDIYVRSSDVDRTLMSAESNLAGLYTPEDSDFWNPDIKWQPIPVHTVPQNIDDLFLYPRCDKYDRLLKEYEAGEEYQKLNDSLTELYDYVTINSGEIINSVENLAFLYDILFVEELYNFKLPNWTEKIYPDPLKKLAEFAYTLQCPTLQTTRLKLGLYLNEIFERFVAKSRGELKPDRKLWIYSAHDINVANVLLGFDSKIPNHIPPYASSIIMELTRDNNGTHYIYTYYKRSENLESISIKGCNNPCELNTALELLKPILITRDQWAQECNEE